MAKPKKMERYVTNQIVSSIQEKKKKQDLFYFIIFYGSIPVTVRFPSICMQHSHSIFNNN